MPTNGFTPVKQSLTGTDKRRTGGIQRDERGRPPPASLALMHRRRHRNAFSMEFNVSGGIVCSSFDGADHVIECTPEANQGGIFRCLFFCSQE